MGMFQENTAFNEHNTTEPVQRLIWYFLPTVVTVPPLGLPLNAVVIRSLLGKPGICSTSDIFTLNLALLNLLFCLMVLGEFINLLCHKTLEAASFLAWGVNQAGGPMLLCLLSLDCYMAVCHPLVYPRLKDPKLRLSMCMVVNFLTVVCCVLVKLASGFKWNFVLFVLSSAILIISTCSLLILHSLVQSGPNKKEVHPVKKRAFKAVLSVFLQINIHYIPPIIEYLLRQFGPRYFRHFSLTTSVAYAILSMGCFVCPLSYLARTKQLHKIKCCRGSAAETKTVARV